MWQALMLEMPQNAASTHCDTEHGAAHSARLHHTGGALGSADARHDPSNKPESSFRHSAIMAKSRQISWNTGTCACARAPEAVGDAAAVDHVAEVHLRLAPEVLEPLEVPDLDVHRLLPRLLDLVRACSIGPQKNPLCHAGKATKHYMMRRRLHADPVGSVALVPRLGAGTLQGGWCMHAAGRGRTQNELERLPLHSRQQPLSDRMYIFRACAVLPHMLHETSTCHSARCTFTRKAYLKVKTQTQPQSQNCAPSWGPCPPRARSSWSGRTRA